MKAHTHELVESLETYACRVKDCGFTVTKAMGVLKVANPGYSVERRTFNAVRQPDGWIKPVGGFTTLPPGFGVDVNGKILQPPKPCNACEGTTDFHTCDPNASSLRAGAS